VWKLKIADIIQVKSRIVVASSWGEGDEEKTISGYRGAGT
jgi:hypothetical protein